MFTALLAFMHGDGIISYHCSISFRKALFYSSVVTITRSPLAHSSEFFLMLLDIHGSEFLVIVA